jgi:alpha-beta hydrolase superfamily lysophospholipase
VKKKTTKSRGLGSKKKPAGRVVLYGGGGEVSNRTRRDLKTLKEFISQHTQLVEQRLAKTGTSPRTALVASAAKYYPTLKKLADK